MGIADILADVMAPPPSRGRRAKHVSVAVSRELNEADIRDLWNKPIGSTTPPLVRLRHQHHFLARLLAEGKPDHEASLITGMCPSRISILKQDPAFSELIKFYAAQVGEAYVNVHERLSVLGLTSTEELMERLEVEPERFSNRELMELAAFAHDRSGHGPTSKSQVTLSVLSPEVLDALKKELASRTNGTVRPLSLPSRSEEPQVGRTIDHEPLAGTETPEGPESQGPVLPEEGRS